MTNISGLWVWFTVLALLANGRLAIAADLTVKQDGSGQFASIQACAKAVHAGDTCLVFPGTYNERVQTITGGTSDSTRVVFKAQGAVRVQGFAVVNPYVTIEGFDITGYSTAWDGLITIHGGGDHCNILNNTLRDGKLYVMGLLFNTSAAGAPDDCVVRGNTLKNLRGHFITTSGNNHLFEKNVLEFQNSWDFVRLFGSNHVFRRNVFRNAGTSDGTGNHPDFLQTFGSAHAPSENHVFEENWIGDLDAQFGQLNSGGVSSGEEIYANYRNVTFRRNIIVNLSFNGNFALPEVRFENNTFYRFAHELSGLSFGGAATRGAATAALLKNNVFLESGTTQQNGFYSLSGATFPKEVVGVFVTNDVAQSLPITSSIYQDLQTHGYINGNGGLLEPALKLTNISQFKIDAAYSAYKEAIYNRLIQTVQLDAATRKTFVADYNYVAGAQSAGFPPKRSDSCNLQETFTLFNFCEAHGINGGNPGLRDLANLLGPDGLPFTLDDGLKPLPTSRLCGAGQGGSDIGAYSCKSNSVFGAGSLPPKPPANLKLSPQE